MYPLASFLGVDTNNQRNSVENALVIGVLGYVVGGGYNVKPTVQSNRDLILAEFDEHMHQVFGSKLVSHDGVM